jgi:hypothetical protein
LLLYDDFSFFVIIFHAKPPSHPTYDEYGNFVTECSHFVTNLVLVTSESSLINNFLLVMKCGLRFWPLVTYIGRRGDGTPLHCHGTATGVDLRAERTSDGPLDISERTSTAPHALPRDGLTFPGDRREGYQRLAARGSGAPSCTDAEAAQWPARSTRRSQAGRMPGVPAAL